MDDAISLMQCMMGKWVLVPYQGSSTPRAALPGECLSPPFLSTDFNSFFLPPERNELAAEQTELAPEQYKRL